MSFSGILRQIAQHPLIVAHPPVLLDVGASKEIHRVWKDIASFSIGIAFDADDRDFSSGESSNSGFKALYKVNKIVVAGNYGEAAPFYLTRSPYCSSLLEPNLSALSPYHYAPLFEVQKEISLNVIKLPEVVAQYQIPQIDWFKTDSQGTDLRLFDSIGAELQNKAIVVEMEPGIVDAYKGEDKVSDCLHYFEKRADFCLVAMKILGPLRMRSDRFERIFTSTFNRKLASGFLPKVPGWAEMAFMNTLEGPQSLRSFLLGWLFATILKRHDMAHGYAIEGKRQYPNESLLTKMELYSTSKLKASLWSFTVLFGLAGFLLGKLAGRK
jgi:hypothetical protein